MTIYYLEVVIQKIDGSDTDAQQIAFWFTILIYLIFFHITHTQP